MPSLEEMKRRKRALESLVPSLSVDDVPASTDIDLSGADVVAPAVGGLQLPESDVSEWVAPPPPPAPRVDSAPPLVSADVEAPVTKSPGLREARGMDSRAQLRRALELAGRQVSAGLLNQRPPSQADLVTQPWRYAEEAQGDFNNDVRQQMERRRDALAALRESNTAKTLDYNMQELARRKAQDETGLDFKKKQLDTTVDEKAKDRAAKEAAAEAKRQAAIAAAKTKAGKDAAKADAKKTAADSMVAIPGYDHDPAIGLKAEAAEKLRGAVADKDALQENLRTLSGLVKQYGIKGFPSEARAEMAVLLRDIQLKLKGPAMYELGVLSGPDLALLEDITGDPTKFEAYVRGGVPGALKRLQVVHDTIGRTADTKLSKRGYSPSRGGAGPGPAMSAKDAAALEWAKGNSDDPRSDAILKRLGGL